MEVKETYYEILGIEADSTEEDIRKAYRKQALLWHPDKNTQRREEAEEKFKLIAEAYEVLSDTEKRRTYDLYGEEGLKNGGPSYDSRPQFPFQFHDPLEIFNSFFGGRDPFTFAFDNGFGQPFGFPSFGARPFGAPFNAGRSPFDNDPFFSPGNFGPSNFGPGNFGPGNFGSGNFGSGTSTFSFSSNSFSGGGRGGYVKQSTTTQIINGVRKTVTTTEDAQGNVTVVTETSDGERQVHNRPQALTDAPRNAVDRINAPIRDEGLYYQQQHPQHQYQQQHHQHQHQQRYQQQQYQEYQESHQYQESQQYQEPQQQTHSQGEDHSSSSHKKHFWSRKK